MKGLTFAADLIRKNPLKLVLLSVVLVLFLAAGAPGLKLATGNETLIETETEAYQNNRVLEKEFGGESIVVLYEAADPKELITIETIKHMDELEKKLIAYEGIYTIVNPNTIINQISAKQSEKFLLGIGEITTGLDKMGSGLNSISGKIGQNMGGQPSGGINLEQNLTMLIDGLAQMIEGQKKLSDGTTQMAAGYSEMGNQLYQAAVKMKNVSDQLGKSLAANPEQQNQAQQLSKMSSQFVEMSKKMNEASVQGSKLTAIPDNTILGLTNMQEGLNSQKSAFSEFSEKQSGQMNDLKTLSTGLSDMGINLDKISSNLGTMISYSDNIYAGLPQKQTTLDKMVYDEDGKMRDMFSEVILDGKYMLFMVKFRGNVDDSVKSEVTGAIKEYLDGSEMDNVKTMVSGKPVLDDAIRTSMRQSMQKMMGLSIVLMILVLTVVFKVKWRLLPLMVILLAVIATVGLMGWLSIPMTMVSMAVFPILIGLGIDYAIQFQSRYTEEMGRRSEI